MPAPSTAPDLLYHYTTLEGVVGIAKSKRLWATSVRHLNDSTEFMYAHNVLKWTLEQNSSDEPADVLAVLNILLRELDFQETRTQLAFTGSAGLTFVTSFSEPKDQLSQWRAYCPNGGVSLGFRREALEKIATEQGFQLVQCSYDKALHQCEAIDLADQVLEAVRNIPESARKVIPPGGGRIPAHVAHHIFPVRNWALNEIQRLAPTWKHEKFHEEREWRLVSKQQPATQFRAGLTAIIPYIQIELDRPELLETDRAAVLGETVVGPCPEPELTVGSLMHLFDVEQIGCSRYVVPDTPYRQW